MLRAAGARWRSNVVPALLALAALAVIGLTRTAPAAPTLTLPTGLPLGTGLAIPPTAIPTAVGAGTLADAVLRNPAAIQGLIAALAANPALAAQLAQSAPQLAQLAQAIMANPALASQALAMAQANPAIVAQLAQVLAANPQLAALATQLISGAGATTPAGALPGAVPGTPAPAAGANPLTAITGLLGQLLAGATGTPATGTPATPMPVPAFTGASGDQVTAAHGILGLLAQRPELRDGRYDATVQGLQTRLGGITADGRIGQQTLTRVGQVLGPQALTNAITPGGSYQGSGIFNQGFSGLGIPGFGGINPSGQGTGPDLSGLFATVAQAAGMGPGGGTPNTTGGASQGFEQLARGFGL